MSQENVEIVRRGFAIWEQGDLEAHLGLVHEDVVCCRVAPCSTRGRTTVWRDTFEFVSDWMEPYEDLQLHPNEFIDAGDRVVAEVPKKVAWRGAMK